MKNQSKNSINNPSLVNVLTIALSLLFAASCGMINSKEAEIAKAKADEQKKYAEEAVRSLKKLDAATDVGINKIDYSKMLIDAQVAVNQAEEKLPDGELKQSITAAMGNYMDAKNLWYLMKEDTMVFVCEKQPDVSGKDEMYRRLSQIACNPEGGELMRKYKISIRNNSGGIDTTGKGLILKKEGIAIIWKTAEENTNRASALLNKS